MTKSADNSMVHVSMNVAGFDYHDLDDLKKVIPDLKTSDTWVSFDRPIDKIEEIRSLCKQAKELGVTVFSSSLIIAHVHKIMKTEPGQVPMFHGAIVVPGRGERFESTMFIGDYEIHADPASLGGKKLLSTRALEGREIDLRFKKSVQVLSFSVVTMKEKAPGRWSPLTVFKGTTYTIQTDKDGIPTGVRVSNQLQPHQISGFIRNNFFGYNDIKRDWYSIVNTFSAGYVEESEETVDTQSGDFEAADAAAAPAEA